MRVDAAPAGGRRGRIPLAAGGLYDAAGLPATSLVMDEACDHIAEADPGIEPSGPGCVECLASGGRWVHLRRCLVCGHVGCCDDSPSRHATAHAHETGHQVIQSYEPDEDWVYCYADDLLTELPELEDSPSHPPGWSPGPPRGWRDRTG